MRYRFAALLLLLVSSSCSVNQALWDPNAFAPRTPYSYYFPPKTGSETKEITRPELPPSDHPLSLGEIIDITLRNTPATTLSWAAAKKAAAAYGSSQAPFFPDIEGVGTYTRAKIPALVNDTVATSLSTTATPQLQLTYTLLDFGQRRATSEAARYSLYFADWSHNRVLQAVVKTVSNDYYFYLFQRHLMSSIEADIETAQTTLNAALAEKMSGVKDISDVLQAKTLLLQTQLNSAAQKKLLQIAFSTLLKDMGIPSDASLSFEELPEHTETDILLKSVDELIADALILRPDLRAQEALVQEKESRISLAYTQFFPALTTQLNYGRTYFQGGLHDKNDWTALFSLSIPLFSGFSTVNAVKEAKAAKESALAALRQNELSITAEITISHTDVVQSKETIAFAREFLDSANDQYEVSLRKYRAGLGTIIDVVSAQSSLSDARSRLAAAEQGWYTALANLVYAAGYYTFKPEEALQ